MRRAVFVVVISLMALPLLAGTPAAAAPTHEETSFGVEIQEDGDAVWTISTTYRLENVSDLTAFEEVRSEHESGANTVPNPALFEAAIASVAEETNRSMELTDINRSSTVKTANNSSLGVLRLSFTWTNFSVVTDDRVSVEAAFAGDWFGDLARNQTLHIQPPPDYSPQRVDPSTKITSGGLQWEGPQTFDPGEPTVVFKAVDPPTPTPPEPEPTQSPMAAGLVGLVLGAAIIFAWRRGYVGDKRATETEAETPPDTSEPEPPTEEDTPPEEPTGDSESGATVDMELLSDEERVLHMLQEHDGRMKQAKIVEKTRWSNAKVSQLLSAMAEANQIEKLRIGRENLISLPDEDE